MTRTRHPWYPDRVFVTRSTPPLVTICGGGEMGTAVAHALTRLGMRVLVLDQPLPGALRLGVAFAAAAVRGRTVVEGIEAINARCPNEVTSAWAKGRVPVWTGDPSSLELRPTVLVDARMRQLSEPHTHLGLAPITLGMGPGFEAGRHVHYVLESNRGPHLGGVICRGSAEPHTGKPGAVLGFREQRVLRSSQSGVFERSVALGALVDQGDVVGHVCGQPVRARLRGMIRGLKLSGVKVGAGHKVGDVDPRQDSSLLHCMTDKAKALARGAVSALTLAGVLARDGALSARHPPRRQQEPRGG